MKPKTTDGPPPPTLGEISLRIHNLSERVAAATRLLMLACEAAVVGDAQRAAMDLDDADQVLRRDL